MISKVNPKQIITFIDTGYHFKETIEFKKRMIKYYNLEVQVVKADQKDFMRTKNEKMWLKNPDKCCDINKVQPIMEKSKNYKIWISGLMGFQNQHRKNLDMFVEKDDASGTSSTETPTSCVAILPAHATAQSISCGVDILSFIRKCMPKITRGDRA